MPPKHIPVLAHSCTILAADIPPCALTPQSPRDGPLITRERTSNGHFRRRRPGLPRQRLHDGAPTRAPTGGKRLPPTPLQSAPRSRPLLCYSDQEWPAVSISTAPGQPGSSTNGWQHHFSPSGYICVFATWSTPGRGSRTRRNHTCRRGGHASSASSNMRPGNKLLSPSTAPPRTKKDKHSKRARTRHSSSGTDFSRPSSSAKSGTVQHRENSSSESEPDSRAIGRHSARRGPAINESPARTWQARLSPIPPTAMTAANTPPDCCCRRCRR